MQPIQILLADPHSLVRDIAAQNFAAEEGIQVVGSTGGGAETLQAVADCCPDVLLMGLDFQDLHGIQVITALRERQHPVQIIALGGENRPEFIRFVLEAGADAYLLKEEAGGMLAESVKRLAGGEKGWFRPASSRPL